LGRLGILIPCRDERAVIERKLRNLAQVEWPDSERPHRIVVIDDESTDGTAEAARSVAETLFCGRDDGLQVEVVANTVRPGKAGAIAAGLASLSKHGVDVVVLTDADVILRSRALPALAHAFEQQARLGMACGSQEFVSDLADDGTPRSRSGGPLQTSPGRYDRWTAVVRALESRAGKLFSVHGQLLAWRADLGLLPTPGIAADDLDLMRQTRAKGFAVIKLPDASFLEVKTPAGPGREAQERRRARAYFQVIGSCRLPPGSPLLDRLHFALYRWLPTCAPIGLALGSMAALLLSWWAWGPVGALAVCAALGLALVTKPGRRLVRLLAVVDAARRAERVEDLGDRWQMAR
jgi:hypothetical protein